MMISHISQKPDSAPVAVVAISSPDPTTAPATMRPGPRALAMPLALVGAGRILLEEVDVFKGRGLTIGDDPP